MSDTTGPENKFITNLERRGLSVNRGFNDEVAQALYLGAQDPVIRYYTQDSERFGTPESTHDWYERAKESRVLYSLSDTAISGVIWFSPSENEYTNAPTTFAIRMYRDARGRGLAGDFLEAAHLDFVDLGGTDTWLSVHKDNETARNLYTKHSYQINQHTKDKKVIMTRRVPKTIE